MPPFDLNWSFTEIRNAACQGCELYKGAQTVCLTGQGPRDARAMIIGESPGLREDDVKRPFSGRSGKLLDRLLAQVGLNRDELYIDNVVRCFPQEIEPTEQHAQACDVYTQKTLELIKPRYVLVLGDLAARHLTGIRRITKNRGRIVTKGEITFLLSIHPAYVLRNPAAESQLLDDLTTFARMVHGESYITPQTVEIADSPERVEEMVRAFELSPFVAYDLETEGLQSWVPGRRIWCLSLSDGTQTWVAPLEHPRSSLGRTGYTTSWATIKGFLEAPGRRLVAQNGQFDMRWLATRGIKVTNVFDTMLAAYLLDENSSIGLKSLASRLFGAPDYSLEVAGWEKTVPPLEKMLWYGACDAFYTANAYLRLRPAIVAKKGLAHCLAWLMMPTSKLLSRIEARGVGFDLGRFVSRQAETKVEMSAVLERMNSYLGEGRAINWNSSDQLAEVLYHRLGLPVLERTPGRKESTREGVLKRLQGKHPLVGNIMTYRGLQKNLTNWLNGWDQRAGYDGRIHSHYRHTGTITGRLSCQDPNLHQVPRAPYIRSILGARPGWLFVEADLSQIELRIVAWLANEPTMKAEFLRGEDAHLKTAMQLTGLAAEDIDKETRKKAKAVNFGFVYGMAWRKFIDYAREKYDVEISDEEAQKAQKAFFDHWPRLAQWHQDIRERVTKYGKISMPHGPVRHLPAASSSDRSLRAEAVRQGINSPVQRFASDLGLMAGCELEGLLGNIVENPRVLDPDEAIIDGQVHDALLFEVREDCLDSVCATIKAAMEHPALLDRFGITIDVPIVVEIRVSTHWSDPDSTIVWKQPTFVLE